jgi:hypothetical protein
MTVIMAVRLLFVDPVRDDFHEHRPVRFGDAQPVVDRCHRSTDVRARAAGLLTDQLDDQLKLPLLTVLPVPAEHVGKLGMLCHAREDQGHIGRDAVVSTEMLIERLTRVRGLAEGMRDERAPQHHAEYGHSAAERGVA